MDYKNYILPINDANDGTGVLVGNYLITAGHVVKGCATPSVFISGQTYYLKSSNRVFLDDNSSKNSEGYDLAVYDLECVNDSLMLSDDVPSKNEKLLSLSYKTIRTKEAGVGVGVFSTSIKVEKRIEQMTGKVIEYYDNYFECLMEDCLCEGKSGSPLLLGNKVVGILIGDKEGKSSSNTVLYLSSKSIVKLLRGRDYGK